MKKKFIEPIKPTEFQDAKTLDITGGDADDEITEPQQEEDITTTPIIEGKELISFRDGNTELICSSSTLSFNSLGKKFGFVWSNLSGRKIMYQNLNSGKVEEKKENKSYLG